MNIIQNGHKMIEDWIGLCFKEEMSSETGQKRRNRVEQEGTKME